MSTGPASRSASLPRFGRGAAVALFLLFLLLGVVFTAPLVRHLRHALPYAAVPTPGRELVYGVQGDYLQFYYYLWLVEERLLSGASFLKDPYQFAIDGARANLPNIFLPAALLFVPLSAFGHRFAYNALVLLSFPFAGMAAALLARRYGVSRAGAFVAGVVFACAPYRVGALLGGHPAGLAYPLVPLVLWGVEGALAGSLGSGLAAGGALLGLALMEPHFAYFAALGLPLYALARVGLPAWRRELLAIGPGAWLAAGAVALALAYGALGALRRQGWQDPLSVNLAIGAVVALLALVIWQALAAWLLAAGVVTDPRQAARRSLVACLPWLLAAVAVTGRGRLVAAALALPLLVHGAWLFAGWRRWWSPRLPVIPVALAVGGGLAAGGFLLLLQRLLLNRSVSGAGRTLHEVLLFSPDARGSHHSGQRGLRPDRVSRRRGARAGRSRRGRALAAAAGGHAPDALDLRAPAGRRHHRVAWPPAGGAPLVRGRVPPRSLVELHPPAGQGPGPRGPRPCHAGGGGCGRPDAPARPRPPGRRRARARAPGRGGLPPVAARRRQRPPRRRPRVRDGPGRGAPRALDPVLARRQRLLGALSLRDDAHARPDAERLLRLARPLVPHRRLPPARDREPRRGRRGRGPGAAPVRRAPGDPRPGRLPAEGERLRPGARARLPPRPRPISIPSRRRPATGRSACSASGTRPARCPRRRRPRARSASSGRPSRSGATPAASPTIPTRRTGG